MGENRELCTCDYRAAQRSTRCQPSCIYIQQRCFILSATVFSYIQHLHCLPQWSAAYLKASLVMFCKKYKFHWEPYSIVLLRLNYGCDVCPDWRLNGVCDCNSVCLCVCVCINACVCVWWVRLAVMLLSRKPCPLKWMRCARKWQARHGDKISFWKSAWSAAYSHNVHTHTCQKQRRGGNCKWDREVMVKLERDGAEKARPVTARGDVGDETLHSQTYLCSQSIPKGREI